MSYLLSPSAAFVPSSLFLNLRGKSFSRSLGSYVDPSSNTSSTVTLCSLCQNVLAFLPPCSSTSNLVSRCFIPLSPESSMVNHWPKLVGQLLKVFTTLSHFRIARWRGREDDVRKWPFWYLPEESNFYSMGGLYARRNHKTMVNGRSINVRKEICNEHCLKGEVTQRVQFIRSMYCISSPSSYDRFQSVGGCRVRFNNLQYYIYTLWTFNYLMYNSQNDS